VSKEHSFERLSDLLTLDAGQMERLIPDLLAWHQTCRELLEEFPEIKAESMTWKDDGRPGELTEIRIYIAKATGGAE